MSESDGRAWVRDLNLALARALGCTSAERLSRVELVIEPGRAPTVNATFLLHEADGLRAVVDTYRLVAQPAEAARDAA